MLIATSELVEQLQVIHLIKPQEKLSLNELERKYHASATDPRRGCTRNMGLRGPANVHMAYREPLKYCMQLFAVSSLSSRINSTIKYSAFWLLVQAIGYTQGIQGFAMAVVAIPGKGWCLLSFPT